MVLAPGNFEFFLHKLFEPHMRRFTVIYITLTMNIVVCNFYVFNTDRKNVAVVSIICLFHTGSPSEPSFVYCIFRLNSIGQKQLNTGSAGSECSHGYI